jgi:hypothetical protein
VNALLMVDGGLGAAYRQSYKMIWHRVCGLPRYADKPFRHQIGSISVANLGPPRRSRPHIELATDRKGRGSGGAGRRKKFRDGDHGVAEAAAGTLYTSGAGSA